MFWRKTFQGYEACVKSCALGRNMPPTVLWGNILEEITELVGLLASLFYSYMKYQLILVNSP